MSNTPIGEGVVTTSVIPEFFDDLWVAENFPEITELQQHVAKGYEGYRGSGLNVSTLKSMYSELGGTDDMEEEDKEEFVNRISRANIRSSKKRPLAISQEMADILSSTTHIFFEMPQEQHEEFIRRELASKLDSVQMSPLIPLISYALQQQYIYHRKYIELSKNISSRTFGIDTGAITTQFKMAKNLAASANNQSDGGHIYSNVFIFGQALIAAAEFDEVKSLPESLLDQAEDHIFDDMIAAEVLRSSDNSLSSDQSQIKDLLELFQAYSPDASNDELIEKVAALHPKWPTDSRLFFNERRSYLVSRLRNFINTAKAVHRDIGIYPPPTDNLAAFNDGVDEVVLKYVRLVNSTSPEKVSKLKRVQMEVATKRRRKSSNVILGATAVGENVDEPTALAIEVSEVVLTDYRNGTRHNRDSDAFRESIDNYVKENGGDPRLRQDIDAIVKYLACIDFSEGIARGIQRYVKPIKINGSEIPVYALKPSEAIGLSTQTTVAKKTRVLFTINNDKTLGILAFAKRDRIDRVENRLGIDTKSHV